MKKSWSNNKFLWESQPISRLQKTLASLLATLPMCLPSIAFADIGDAAKTSGTKLATILYIVLIVVGGVCILIGAIMHATGSQQLAQKGQTRIMYAMFGVGGGLLVGTILKWVYDTATASGGGNIINWPF